MQALSLLLSLFFPHNKSLHPPCRIEVDVGGFSSCCPPSTHLELYTYGLTKDYRCVIRDVYTHTKQFARRESEEVRASDLEPACGEGSRIMSCAHMNESPYHNLKMVVANRLKSPHICHRNHNSHCLPLKSRSIHFYHTSETVQHTLLYTARAVSPTAAQMRRHCRYPTLRSLLHFG